MSKQDKNIELSLPNDWVPLFEWANRHYRKQIRFSQGIGKYFVNMFLAGNGTGKTNIIYWNYVALTLGIHPIQSKEWCKEYDAEKKFPMPPLRLKILVTDFEHGLNTIARETLLDSTYLPDGTTIGPLLPASAVKSYWNKEDKTIRFHNGSIWHFMTSEQHRRLHSGTNFDVLGCDEEPEEPAYDESLRGLRTAKGGGRVIMGMTPPYEEGKGPSWTKFRIYEPWLEGDASINVVQAAMKENPAITEKFIEEFSKGKTDEQLQVQLYGKFPSFGKVCFPYFKKELWDAKTGEGNILPKDWKVPDYREERYRYDFGLDYHDAKAPAALWTIELPDGDIVVYDELHPLDIDNRTVRDVAGHVYQIEGDEYFSTKVVRRVGDPKMKDTSNAMIRGFNAWDYFRRCGIVLSEGYNRDPGISYAAINEYFRGDRKNHPRLYIRENCVNTIRALENHYWEKDGKPDSVFSDYVVCLKYIIQKKKPQVTNKRYRRRRGDWPLTSWEAVRDNAGQTLF